MEQYGVLVSETTVQSLQPGVHILPIELLPIEMRKPIDYARKGDKYSCLGDFFSEVPRTGLAEKIYGNLLRKNDGVPLDDIIEFVDCSSPELNGHNFDNRGVIYIIKNTWGVRIYRPDFHEANFLSSPAYSFFLMFFIPDLFSKTQKGSLQKTWRGFLRQCKEDVISVIASKPDLLPEHKVR